jgi:20S proteasome alpha/beta subunit
MTIGIAAICRIEEAPSVILCSDRMLTTGDIEFQSPTRKNFRLTSHVGAVIAGDVATQTAVLQSTAAEAQNLELASVQEIASVFAENLARHNRAVVEREVLFPLGLTIDKFAGSTGQMDHDLSMQISQALTARQNGTAAIVAGVEPSESADQSLAHIYYITGAGVYRCLDHIGFAAIGIGEHHAASQFMIREYGPEFGMLF